MFREQQKREGKGFFPVAAVMFLSGEREGT